MTDADIERMAREAFPYGPNASRNHYAVSDAEIAKFAALVVAASREPLTASQLMAAVMADETLRYYFALNGGAGPVSEKGVKIFRAVESAIRASK